jgi:hypothetical protein
VKRIITIIILSILTLVLTACGAAAAPSQANSSSGSSAANPAPVNGTPASGPSVQVLAAGMLKLEGTSNAVTAQEAAKLLPLWQSFQQIESTAVPQAGSQGTPGARPYSRADPAMMQQIDTQVVLIQNAMMPAQIQAITAMNLSRQDIFTAFQGAGITIGGPGQGGGFGPNGGTFTPRQGTPPASGTPGAFRGNGGFGPGGNFPGGRQGFGNFMPPNEVNGIIQFLQKKAGS